VNGSQHMNGISERVLIVDDDEAGRYAKARILRQAGYGVLEAASGGAALQQVTLQKPDLVLLDVCLPDVNGVEVCRRIKANPQTSPIPVLQMSASYLDERSKVASLEGGADGYITEPVEPSLLVATIGAFMRIRRAEQAARERALEWQATFDAISDGVALTDCAGRILRWNSAMASLFQREPADLTGATMDQLLPPAEGEAAIWTNLSSGQRQYVERRAGESVYALTVDPVRTDGGELHRAVCLVCDITERKLMDERLWHTQKLESIGLLAGGVAHDFNNLLVGVLGNASLGLDALYDPQSTERAFRDIIRASERAADLTRQLLAYAGKGRFVVQPLDMSSAVTAMLPLVRASFPHKVELVLDLAGGLPPVRADRTQIEQIIMNLLINAAEAVGDRGGVVTVTTKAVEFASDQRSRYLADTEVRGSYVTLEVHDNGSGMEEETLRQIFDPFFTTKFMGRGLGLSAVLGIVRGHKGALRVTSAPGQGAAFELLFPSAAVESRTPATATGNSHESRAQCTGTILLVDDEQIVRDFFKAALERQGYEVVCAVNGAEAWRIFTREPRRFSLVVLDLVMPVMSGKEVLPLLLDARPGLQVVLTSGQVEEEVRRELGDCRIAGFIQKPCAMQMLVEKIRAVAVAGSAAG
jgi:two-component system cell cycle sensor histidine kinase/response regulator CckA